MLKGKSLVFQQYSHIVGKFLSVSLVLALAIPFAHAQEVPQTYSFAGGDASLVYNESWMLETNENKSVTLTQGEIRVTLYAPSFIVANVQLTDASTGTDVMQGMRTFLKSDTQTRFDEARLSGGILANLRPVSLYSYSPADTNLSGLYAAIQFSDGTFGFADAVFPVSFANQSQQDVLNLLNGFNSGVQACTVSTNRVNTVQVRVGPGFNRGVNTFLPANRDFTVLGQAAVEADGSTPYPPCMYRCGPGENHSAPIWWKLDKSEVAPQSAAAELWIAAEDVDESPSCNNSVPTAEPPTLVPLRTAVASASGTPASPFDSSCPGSTSEQFVAVMWNTQDLNILSACMSNLLIWQSEARAQQAARLATGPCDINHGPTPSEKDAYFASYWALADIGTGYYIMGTRYRDAGQASLSQKAFSTLANNYYCAWAWDPQGWFWWLSDGLR